MIRYRVKKERRINGVIFACVGDIVYENVSHDYGMSRLETFATGVNHISVVNACEKSNGFFTIPSDDLEVVK